MIVEELQKGSYIETAAARARIARSTLYTWLDKGERAQSGRYREFYLDVLEALAEYELQHLQRINEAAKLDWKASKWLLERRFPARWGKQVILPPSDEDEVEIDREDYGTGDEFHEEE